MEKLMMKNLKLKDIDYSDENYEKALNNRTRIEPREDFDCEICKNYEYNWVVKNGERLTRTCSCVETRNSLSRIRKSGLSEQIEFCKFANFQTPEFWQQNLKKKVLDFVGEKNRRWLFIAGQSGCGKTHLCTAVAAKFLKAGVEVRYMRWIHESSLLKSLINNEFEYEKRMNELKTCRVLYIDDFFKTQQGQIPTPADVKLAFDLIDYRYINQKLITIISTERTMSEIIEIDTATGGRIYDMTKGYCIEIFGKDKNWRLK